MNLRDLLVVGAKLKESICKNSNPISSTDTTKTWVLSAEWSRTWPSIGIRAGKWCWLPFVWIVNVVLQGVWLLHHINKDEGGKSLPLLAFRRQFCQFNFSEIFKRRQIILEPFRNSKYPIRCLLWWHKTWPGAIWTQTYSEHLQTSKKEGFWINS